MWNFHGCWQSVTQFFNISSLVLSGIFRGKVTNLKIPGIFQKSMPSTSCLDCFWSLSLLSMILTFLILYLESLILKTAIFQFCNWKISIIYRHLYISLFLWKYSAGCLFTCFCFSFLICLPFFDLTSLALIYLVI